MILSARGSDPALKRFIHRTCYDICDYINLDRKLTAKIHVSLLTLDDETDGQTYVFRNAVYVEIHKTLLETPALFLEILAHELVHAKQYLNKELYFYRTREYWMGEKIEKKFSLAEHVMKLPDEEYRNLPWEKEAFSTAEELLNNQLNDRIIILTQLTEELHTNDSRSC